MIAHFTLSWSSPVKIRKTLIGGTKKMIIYDDMEPSEKVKVYDKGVDIIKDPEQIYDMLVQYRTGDMWAPKIEITEALKNIALEFTSAINENRKPFTDGKDGWKVVRILEAANKSIKNNGQVVEL